MCLNITKSENLNKKKYKLPNSIIFNFYYKKLKLFTKRKTKLRLKRNETISKVITRGKAYIHQGRL
jgi:hypothetical protein